MFSICIPTYERYDNFLCKILEKYIINDLVDEIIITDDSGNDIEKIKKSFNSEKLRLFKNEKRLGIFFNKLECCKYAKNDWIALLDSDNFADKDYFQRAENYIKSNTLTDSCILAPSFAKPNFDYRFLNDQIIKKDNLKDFLNNNNLFETFLNTCNYVLNKSLVEKLIVNEPESKIYESPTDSLLFLILYFEQRELEIHVLRDMHYDHKVHDDSTFLKTYNLYKNEINQINARLKILIS
jgi:glycosyltransferase involved in cell wall biosynthesis